MSSGSMPSSSLTMLPLVAQTERALQRLTSCFTEACQLFGVEVTLKKDWGPPQAFTPRRVPPPITIGETKLKAFHQFTYLGSTISSDASIDWTVDYRLAKEKAFSADYKRVGNWKYLKKGIKISFFLNHRMLLYSSGVIGNLLPQFAPFSTFPGASTSPMLRSLDQTKITKLDAMLLKSQLCCEWRGFACLAGSV